MVQWRFATEDKELADRLRAAEQGDCPKPPYGPTVDELGALLIRCRAALAGRDEELAAWRRWVEIERKAQEELGRGQIVN